MMLSRSSLLLPLAMLVGVAVPALAQAPAPAAAPAPVAAPAKTAAPLGVPTHNCIAPEYPGKLATNARIATFNADYKAYGSCIKKYIDDNRSLINAVVETNNKTVDEYNKYTEKLKEEIEAAKE